VAFLFSIVIYKFVLAYHKKILYNTNTAMVTKIRKKLFRFFNYKPSYTNILVRSFHLMKISHRVNHNKITLDITYDCNLKCVDCNRSCGQAPSKENISVEQIKKFIDESKKKQRKWHEIVVEGGEPTLHPNILEIIDLLLKFKKHFSPKTIIRMTTNGYGSVAEKILPKVPEGILIGNTRKKSTMHEHHCIFNIAPIDIEKYKNARFSKGCFLPSAFGIGLTRYGYYPHAICGGVDRIFGFDIARKSLPSKDDSMEDQMDKLCRYCGHFVMFDKEIQQKRERGEMTLAWEKAYANYRQVKSAMSLY